MKYHNCTVHIVTDIHSIKAYFGKNPDIIILDTKNHCVYMHHISYIYITLVFSIYAIKVTSVAVLQVRKHFV